MAVSINGVRPAQQAATRAPQPAVVDTRLTRDKIAVGTMFKVHNRSGKLGTKTYAAIGRNGKHLSINVDTGELASTKKGSRHVKPVGGFKYEVTLTPGLDRKVSRKDVRDGEVYQMVNRDGSRGKLYGAAGVADNGEATPRYIGVTFDTQDNSTTENGDKSVAVVGAWGIRK